MTILLDTHCWVWLMFAEERKFSRRTRAAIERARAQDQCWVSVMSVWEVSNLNARGRLRLGQHASDWAAQALLAPGFALAPVTAAAAWEAGTLPMHGDPVDRLIVATARDLNATLVTADALILDRPSLCRTLAAH